MIFDEQSLGLGSWTCRKFAQMRAASAVSASVGHLAHAEESTTHGTMIDVPFERRNPHIAMIGTGGRGTALLVNLLAADGEVVALCDIVKEKAEHAASMVQASGQKMPVPYTDGPHAFEAMLARSDIDCSNVRTSGALFPVALPIRARDVLGALTTSPYVGSLFPSFAGNSHCQSRYLSMRIALWQFPNKQA
jgi:hypothetical protein